MKKLSIEDKARRYDEALKEAAISHKDEDKHLKATLERIFPTLKESEDERIRKALIRLFQSNNTEQFGEFTNRQFVAWLEKQGESDETKAKIFLINKGYPIDANGKFPAYEEMYDIIKEGLEKQGEQESVAKVTPKYKVGDWCIDNEDGTIFQIVKVLDNTYTYKTNEGKEYTCSHYSLENDARFWTIQDSKNGDVLATPDGNAFISRGCIDKFHPGKPVAYCGLDCEGCFFIPSGITWWTDDEIHPATKKERDLLFSKMHKAGYEWDAEKKELKEIEKLPKGEDYGIDGLYAAIDILKKKHNEMDEGMKASEIIEGIKNLKEQTARNSMGCSENWYDFYYAMKETFTLEEIQSMTARECELLERLAANIQEGLY